MLYFSVSSAAEEIASYWSEVASTKREEKIESRVSELGSPATTDDTIKLAGVMTDECIGVAWSAAMIDVRSVVVLTPMDHNYTEP